MDSTAKSTIQIFFLFIIIIIMFADPPIAYAMPLHPQELVTVERYEWADEAWIHHAAGIVAGETPHDCFECDLWIACTIVGDIKFRNYYKWGLHPGRWHGMKRPMLRHYEAVVQATTLGGCARVPVCRYLGNDGDYRYWRSVGIADNKEVRAIGGSRSSIYCIPPN